MICIIKSFYFAGLFAGGVGLVDTMDSESEGNSRASQRRKCEVLSDMFEGGI